MTPLTQIREALEAALMPCLVVVAGDIGPEPERKVRDALKLLDALPRTEISAWLRDFAGSQYVKQRVFPVACDPDELLSGRLCAIADSLDLGAKAMNDDETLQQIKWLELRVQLMSDFIDGLRPDAGTLRFQAACAALSGLLAKQELAYSDAASEAIKYADALMVALVPTEESKP